MYFFPFKDSYEISGQFNAQNAIKKKSNFHEKQTQLGNDKCWIPQIPTGSVFYQSKGIFKISSQWYNKT